MRASRSPRPCEDSGISPSRRASCSRSRSRPWRSTASCSTGDEPAPSRQGLGPRRGRYARQARDRHERARTGAGIVWRGAARPRGAARTLPGRGDRGGGSLSDPSAPRRQERRRRCSSAGPTSLPQSAQYWRPFARRKRRSWRCCPIFPSRSIGGRLGDPDLSLLHLNPWLASAARRSPFRSMKAAHAVPGQDRDSAEPQAVARDGSVVLKAFREVENWSPTSSCSETTAIGPGVPSWPGPRPCGSPRAEQGRTQTPPVGLATPGWVSSRMKPI